MLYHDIRIFRVLLVILVISRAYGTSWDLAVTIGQEIEFLSNNGTTTERIKNNQSVDLASISYSETLHTVFSGDRLNKNFSIFSQSFLDNNNYTMNHLLPDENGSHILGMSYDELTQTLYWNDFEKRTIFRMSVKSDNNILSEPEAFLRLTEEERPLGITVDLCNRRLYWVNSDVSNPSIESINLDGTDRQVVVKYDIFEPTSVTIDYSTKLLYWIDDEDGTSFKIEYSNLNGSNRRLLVREFNQQPVSLAVDKEYVYWTDWIYNVIWRIEKFGKRENSAVEWKRFHRNIQKGDPSGLISRENVGFVDCTVNTSPTTVTTIETEDENTLYTIVTISSAEEHSITTIEPENVPENVQTHDKVVAKNETSCNCTQRSLPKKIPTEIYTIYHDLWTKKLTIMLSAIIGVLLLVIAVLSYLIHKLRKRPRIKKRFLVSKSGITPLTSRPQVPSDQCEIMIENCCNMNICETPCYEPKPGNARKDDKNALLDNVETINSC